MGYIWVPVKNVIVKGVTHAALRDDANHSNQGKIILLCEVELLKFRRRKSYARTKRPITCMLCMNEVE